MSIANYLTAIDTQRDQLARNLTAMGVPASVNEKLNTLVPKVLQIPQTKPEITLFRASIDALHDFGENIYTFYNDGYRSLAGFAETYPHFCCEDNGYAIYYSQDDFNWGSTIYTMCTDTVRITSAKQILFIYNSGFTESGEMWLVPKSNQSLSPSETARYIYETIQSGRAVSVPFGWLNSVGNFITVLHDCSDVPTGDYHLAWKAVTDNTHPIIRKIKVLEVS